MHQVVTARRRWVNYLAVGWVNFLAVGWVNFLAENPLPWVNYLAAGWVNFLAVEALKWVVCVAVDTRLEGVFATFARGWIRPPSLYCF
jgi:hypothetical protein